MYERRRGTELLIDIKAMIYNYEQIKNKVCNKKILPVLKASGYGIGAKNVKKFLDRANIDMVGTAFVDEGIVLRAGLDYKGKIIVLNQPTIEDIDNIVEYNITTGICYYEFAEKLNKKCKEKNKKCKIHIEIETGMGRTGVPEKNIYEFVQNIKKLDSIEVEGIYTHFATSDNDIEYAKEQIKRFEKAVSIIKQEFNDIEYIHCANSGGILNITDYPGNMVRPGIMLYGYCPNEELKENIQLKPVCKLKSKISFIKEVEEKTSISYGRTYITKRKSIIANVPIGYADGIKRALSNKGHVVVNGKKAPIVGTICMDSFMIDVTGIDVKIGDDVYIWDNKNITVEEIAKQCETINYEILSTISNRVIRKEMK